MNKQIQFIILLNYLDKVAKTDTNMLFDFENLNFVNVKIIIFIDDDVIYDHALDLI